VLSILIGRKIVLKGINVRSHLDLDALNRAVSVNSLSFTQIIDWTFRLSRQRRLLSTSGRWQGCHWDILTSRTRDRLRIHHAQKQLSNWKQRLDLCGWEEVEFSTLMVDWSPFAVQFWFVQ